MNSIATTPLNISKQILSLCRRLDPSQEPSYVPVQPWMGGRVDNCFYNVEDRVKVDGGHIQYGWTIWENPGVLVEGEFHAVWVSPSNEFVDTTPKVDGETEILFLPDTNRVWERQMVENVRFPLVDNAYTRQLIRHSEAMFKLRVKYWDSDSGISKIPLEEMQRLSNLDAVPSPSIPTMKVGRNQPCPCGSDKKYKKCHGA